MEKYPQAEWQPVPEPPLVLDRVIEVGRQPLEIAWGWENERDAYGVRLEPAAR